MEKNISFFDKIAYSSYHKSKKIKLNVTPIQFFAKYIFLQQKSKGEFLIKEGEQCDKMYYFESGLVKVFSTKNGHEIVTWFSHEGQFLTLANSFVHDIPSHESIEVLEDISYYAIPKKLYFQLMGFSTQITLFTMFEMLDAVCEYQTQTIILRTLKSQDKYQHFVDHYPALLQRINQKDLASFIGLEETYLSKILNEQKKLVSTNKKG
jgi:CRP-like cAMP-binding protein